MTVLYSCGQGETLINKAVLSLAQFISPVTPVCSCWLSLVLLFSTACTFFPQVTTKIVVWMLSTSSSLNVLSSSLPASPSLSLWLWLTAPGMRAGPSFGWHQRAGNSSSIKASSHESLLRGLQPRAATSSWGEAWEGGTDGIGRKKKKTQSDRGDNEVAVATSQRGSLARQPLRANITCRGGAKWESSSYVLSNLFVSCFRNV